MTWRRAGLLTLLVLAGFGATYFAFSIWGPKPTSIPAETAAQIEQDHQTLTQVVAGETPHEQAQDERLDAADLAVRNQNNLANGLADHEQRIVALETANPAAATTTTPTTPADSGPLATLIPAVPAPGAAGPLAAPQEGVLICTPPGTVELHPLLGCPGARCSDGLYGDDGTCYSNRARAEEWHVCWSHTCQAAWTAYEAELAAAAPPAPAPVAAPTIVPLNQTELAELRALVDRRLQEGR